VCELVDALFAHGWTPVDLAETAGGGWTRWGRATAYAGRIRERLEGSTRSAMGSEQAAGLLPVLAARSQAVEEIPGTAQSNVTVRD
jgi:hypothetical protein